MTTAQRIVLNTLAAYGRTVFAMALGLFSSRWVLQSLGSVDYGLMSVVGGLIAFVSFLNGISSTACTRFFALSIGKGDADETNRWFNTALSIHMVLPLVLVVIGYPVGEWAVRFFLSIPPDRLVTASWVFRYSLVSAFWSMASTPFMAMYTAKQNIAELSLWGMMGTLINFFFVFWLTTYRGDAWLVYAGVTVVISISLGLGQVLRAHHIFPECRVVFSRWYEWPRIRQVFSYAGWTLFGGLGWLMQSQGMAIVLNKFFPPMRFKAVNASYAIGGTVATYTQTLSSALMNAFLPEITAAEGRGDRANVIHQMLRVARFSFFLTLLFAIPLVFETSFVLKLWLKTPPVHAVLFCRTFLVAFMITRLMAGVDTAICATGRIMGYQIVMGSCLILSVPVACLILWLHGGLPGLCGILIGLAVVQVAGGACFAQYLVGCPVRLWGREVLFPCFIATFGAILLTYGAQRLMPLFPIPLWLCSLFVIVFSGLAAVIIGWYWLFTPSERSKLLDQGNCILQKMGVNFSEKLKITK